MGAQREAFHVPLIEDLLEVRERLAGRARANGGERVHFRRVSRLLKQAHPVSHPIDL